MDNERRIGEVGNYYGNLFVATDGPDRYLWGIENWDGIYWEVIPKSLYDELVKFEEGR